MSRRSQVKTASASRKDSAVPVASFEDGSRVISYNGKELTFQIGLHYAGKPLFQLSQISLEHGCCYGLSAPNGSGKTSLLNSFQLLPGFPEESLDWSHVRSDWSELDLGASDGCVKPLDYLLRVLRKRQYKLQTHIEALEKRLEAGVDDGQAAERLCFLYDMLTALDEDSFARAATEALTKLGFESHSGTGGPCHMDKLASELSGGWRYKLKLAEVLLSQPQLLLIDEPSFLDEAGTDWLISYIREESLKQRAIVVLTSHKFHILDELADRVLFITPETEDKAREVIQFNGTYASFLQAQMEEEARQTSENRNFAEEAAQAQRALKTLQRVQVKSEKSTRVKILQNPSQACGLRSHASHCQTKGATVAAKQQLLQKQKQEQLDKLQNARNMAKHHFASPLQIKGEVAGTLGVPILCIQNVSFGYGIESGKLKAQTENHLLLSGLNLAIYPKDRIALVGCNGSGKSTLIQLIMQILEPLDGSVHYPNPLRIAYFPQNAAMEFLLPENEERFGQGRSCAQVLIEEWSQARDGKVMSLLQARTHLAAFGLKDDVATARPVTNLSTGQRTRLYFAMLLLPQLLGRSSQLTPNLLVLDEVSDNLDQDTVESLIDCLEGFGGAILAASHERASFLDRFCSIEWLAKAGHIQVTTSRIRTMT